MASLQCPPGRRRIAAPFQAHEFLNHLSEKMNQAPNDSTPLNEAPATNPEETKKSISIEELREKLMVAGKKIVESQEIGIPTRLQLQQAIERLEQLRTEISEKVAEVESQGAQIREKIDSLASSQTINVDQSEVDEAEKGVSSYTELLNNIASDVESEIAHMKQFLDEDEKRIVIADMAEPDTMDALIGTKIKRAKKYVRSVTRDLRISFSRYHYSFKAQMQRLNYVERLAKLKR